ncbi:AAA family ATPase, partial [Bathymodiolus thermophilus thioautotrophic gill symbiont]|uniref:AAA family ATPase n=1 Tax=Bathymodiolus thermophilus thioautotrophic gill symbiont TaxID=2360 RepID=UPI0015D56FE5
MIEYIDIKDYKCFKDFKIEGLSRINIISGKNNVGKTALLEAFLLTQEFGEVTIAKNRNIDKNQYTNYLKGFSFFISTDVEAISFEVQN